MDPEEFGRKWDDEEEGFTSVQKRTIRLNAGFPDSSPVEKWNWDSLTETVRAKLFAAYEE